MKSYPRIKIDILMKFILLFWEVIYNSLFVL